MMLMVMLFRKAVFFNSALNREAPPVRPATERKGF
jgi:hypothetical protein